MLGAPKGQTMNVSLGTKHTATCFNIIAPGENEAANYRLEMIDYGKLQAAAPAHPTAAPVAAGSAPSAGKVDGFDATGQVPCARHSGQPMGRCAFGVTRKRGGNASVVVTQPDGNPPFSVQRESDLNIIRVGSERYEIRDAAVCGG